MAETRVEIIEDVNDIVTFETITTDTVSRIDVRVAEERIAILEGEVAERVAEIETLKEKIAHAKEIIALADAKKLAEEEANAQDEVTEEVVGG